MTAPLFPPRPRLRLVEKTPLAPRRYLTVQINVLDGRSPFGSSRAFRNTEDDLCGLVAQAERLERRA
jgi:hypothetical protein